MKNRKLLIFVYNFLYLMYNILCSKYRSLLNFFCVKCYIVSLYLKIFLSNKENLIYRISIFCYVNIIEYIIYFVKRNVRMSFI